jgi:hypothetical protein
MPRQRLGFLNKAWAAFTIHIVRGSVAIVTKHLKIIGRIIFPVPVSVMNAQTGCFSHVAPLAMEAISFPEHIGHAQHLIVSDSITSAENTGAFSPAENSQSAIHFFRPNDWLATNFAWVSLKAFFAAIISAFYFKNDIKFFAARFAFVSGSFGLISKFFTGGPTFSRAVFLWFPTANVLPLKGRIANRANIHGYDSDQVYYLCH